MQERSDREYMYCCTYPCIQYNKMAITVGISKIVIIIKYVEDGAEILKQANVQLLEMDPYKVQYWLIKLAIIYFMLMPLG